MFKSAQISVFLLFLWLYLWFSWISMGEIFKNVHSWPGTHWDTNVKEEKSRVCKANFSIFFQIYASYAAKKLTLQISLKN